MPADCCTITASGELDLTYLPDIVDVRMESTYNMRLLPQGWVLQFSPQRRELFAVRLDVGNHGAQQHRKSILKISESAAELTDPKQLGHILAHFLGSFCQPQR
jgi:hypothetical protein